MKESLDLQKSENTERHGIMNVIRFAVPFKNVSTFVIVSYRRKPLP